MDTGATVRSQVMAALATGVDVVLVGSLGVGTAALCSTLPAGAAVCRARTAPPPAPGTIVVRYPRWTDSEIQTLAAGLGCPDSHRDQVIALSGGISLITHACCRALAAGVTARGALADAAAHDIVARLAAERPRGGWKLALRELVPRLP